MVDAARHPKVDVRTYTEVERVEGLVYSLLGDRPAGIGYLEPWGTEGILPLSQQFKVVQALVLVGFEES